MVVAYALTLLGGYAAVLFLALCVATGLFYAAELAEEHTVATGKVLKQGLRVVTALHGLLWLDGFAPLCVVLLATACHGGYYLLLVDFPNLDVATPAFALSAIGLVVDHVVWTRHLASAAPLPFFNLIGFFLIFVWVVPFAFFVSLSVNDASLPTTARRPDAKSTTLAKRLAAAALPAAVVPTHPQRAHSKTY